MSPQTDAVSLCGHINIKQIIMKSTVKKSEDYGLEKDEERNKCLMFPFLAFTAVF